MRLIDKDELIEDIENEKCSRCHYLGTSECYSCTIRDIVFGIGQYPTVDAVPVVHGKWIYPDYYGEEFSNTMICSECDFECLRDVFDYCPECGAKMDGDLNEAD